MAKKKPKQDNNTPLRSLNPAVPEPIEFTPQVFELANRRRAMDRNGGLYSPGYFNPEIHAYNNAAYEKLLDQNPRLRRRR